MEDPTLDPQILDIAPDPLIPKTWDEQVVTIDIAGKYGKPYQSTNFIEGSRGWRLNSNGVAEFSGLIIRDVLYTVPLNGNIQEAINVLNNAGGGTVQLQSGTYTLTADLTLSDGIHLVGTGIDSTIIEFSGGAYGVIAAGTSGNILTNWSIENLTIQNSNNIAGIEVDYADYWKIENVKISSCDQNGLQISRSQYYSLNSVTCTSNSLVGILFNGSATPARAHKYFTVTGCICTSNTTQGIQLIASGDSAVNNGVFLNCVTNSNTENGFYVSGGDVNADTSITNCFSDSNTTRGYYITAKNVTLMGCSASSNTSYGIQTSQPAQIVGCRFHSNNSNGYQVYLAPAGKRGSVFVGNEYNNSLATAGRSLFIETDEEIAIVANSGDGYDTEKKTLIFHNNSGGSLARGDVVVYSPSAGIHTSMTTTTTQGDDKVLGMVIETISSAAHGGVLTEGYTESLKVDGTTDIAVGDFLCTHTTAKIAMKAAAGDMAFAIALEAYTANNSSGVIDAVLITPRKL